MRLNAGQLSPWRKRGGGRDPTVPGHPQATQMGPAAPYARIHTNNYVPPTLKANPNPPTLLFHVKHRKSVMFLDGGVYILSKWKPFRLCKIGRKERGRRRIRTKYLLV